MFASDPTASADRRSWPLLGRGQGTGLGPARLSPVPQALPGSSEWPVLHVPRSLVSPGTPRLEGCSDRKEGARGHGHERGPHEDGSKETMVRGRRARSLPPALPGRSLAGKQQVPEIKASTELGHHEWEDRGLRLGRARERALQASLRTLGD